MKSRGFGSYAKSILSNKWTLLFCISNFCAGLLFTDRIWNVQETKDIIRTGLIQDERKLISDGCNSKLMNEKLDPENVLGEASRTNTTESLDKTIEKLEKELTVAKAQYDSILKGAPSSETMKAIQAPAPNNKKYLMVVGINTAFSSRRRRDSVRATWMPQGERRRMEEKGIIIRFIIGHSATPGGILDRAIEAEDRRHGDFLRLEHIEGYLELSAKTKVYFASAVTLWDAEFYVKVDDDVHVNIETLGITLAKYKSKPRVYTGCMKSDPVLAKKGVRYHEPEFWKFGDPGNKYFRHAIGQLYAISKDLATYILENKNLLHKYANEDVSLGSWFIGLDVEYINDRRFCCGTPPDCEVKAQAGNICIASFDWNCSGICKSVERMREIHGRCGESSFLRNRSSLYNRGKLQ